MLWLKQGKGTLGYGGTIIKKHRVVFMGNVYKRKIIRRLWSIFFWYGDKEEMMTIHQHRALHRMNSALSLEETICEYMKR